MDGEFKVDDDLHMHTYILMLLVKNSIGRNVICNTKQSMNKTQNPSDRQKMMVC